MKDGWQTKPLNEICQFSNGLWKGEKPPFINVGVIRNTNFTKEGALDDSDIAYIDVEEKKFEKRRLQFGDIILEKSGGGPKQPVGRVVLFNKKDGDFSFSNFTAALRVLDPRELDFRFLHKFLHWTYLSGVTEGMQSHSTGIHNLDGDAYKAIKISFPTLPEQQRIVDVLDRAFTGIASARADAEKNLNNARALFASHLQSVFTQPDGVWPTKQLGDVCEFEGGSQPPKSQFSYAPKPGYVRFLQIRDFKSENHVTFIPESKKNRLCLEGDIMIGRYGASVGKILTGKSGAYNVALMKAIPDLTILDRDFFYHYLISDAFQDRLMKVASRSAQDGFSKDDIFRFPVPVPPLREQQKVIKRIGPLSVETKHLESIYQRKIVELDALKKSLLNAAFSGKL
jgi:type I restriction enzyme S subunit